MGQLELKKKVYATGGRFGLPSIASKDARYSYYSPIQTKSNDNCSNYSTKLEQADGICRMIDNYVTRKKKREIRSYVISENDFGLTQGSKPDALGLQNVSKDTIQYPYINKLSQKPWTDADLQNDHFCAYKKLSSTRISKLLQKQKRSFPGIPKTKSNIFIKAKLRVVLKATLTVNLIGKLKVRLKRVDENIR